MAVKYFPHHTYISIIRDQTTSLYRTYEANWIGKQLRDVILTPAG